mgnify:CR=1 FL=1
MIEVYGQFIPLLFSVIGLQLEDLVSPAYNSLYTCTHCAKKKKKMWDHFFKQW